MSTDEERNFEDLGAYVVQGDESIITLGRIPWSRSRELTRALTEEALSTERRWPVPT